MTSIGLPYARAITVPVVMEGARHLDHLAYFLVCPVCGCQLEGEGRTEDQITKSASRKYAAHYARTHVPDDPALLVTGGEPCPPSRIRNHSGYVRPETPEDPYPNQGDPDE